jgi:hypothetical protein
MSAAALRRLIVAGKLGAELIAGKYYVILADIEEMRSRCREKQKVPVSGNSYGVGRLV